jgi:hypothetical protein
LNPHKEKTHTTKLNKSGVGKLSTMKKLTVPYIEAMHGVQSNNGFNIIEGFLILLDKKKNNLSYTPLRIILGSVLA